MLQSGIDIDLLRNFAIALSIGALVGVDRERKHERDLLVFGGFRTFIFIAMAGAISAWIDRETGQGWLFLGGGAGLTLLIVASYQAAAQRTDAVPGLTTEISAIVVYLLGGGTLLGFPEITVPLAVIASGILTFKTTLHDFVGKLDEEDIVAMLKLLFATFIILPTLPNHTVDPWGALNPYLLWWLVILISSLSLVGYVAVRWLGAERGLAVTGFFGGLVSSTAMTLSFARRSKLGTDPPALVSMGILLAWAVMFTRVVIAVAVVNLSLVPPLLAPMGAMGAAALLCAGVLYLRGRTSAQASGGSAPPALENPFSLTQAIRFGALFAVILLVVSISEDYLPDTYMYVVAAVAGTTDVDAISLSLAAAAGQSLDNLVAVVGIIIAAVSNTWTKAIIVGVLGGRPVALHVAGATLLITGAAALAIGAQWMI